MPHPDINIDAVKQSSGRYQAHLRKLDGTPVWTGARVHPTRRAALIEAQAETLAYGRAVPDHGSGPTTIHPEGYSS